MASFPQQAAQSQDSSVSTADIPQPPTVSARPVVSGTQSARDDGGQKSTLDLSRFDSESEEGGGRTDDDSRAAVFRLGGRCECSQRERDGGAYHAESQLGDSLSHLILTWRFDE